jgi:hypothetical protein
MVKKPVSDRLIVDVFGPIIEHAILSSPEYKKLIAGRFDSALTRHRNVTRILSRVFMDRVAVL